MMDTWAHAQLERGQEYKGYAIAVRVICRVHKDHRLFNEPERTVDVVFPRRDSRFGILGSNIALATDMQTNIIEGLHLQEAKDGDTLWARHPYQFGHAVFIGYSYKLKGRVSKSYGWEDEGSFAFGAKKVKLATLAVRGAHDGFVLLYAFPDDLYIQGEDEI